MKSLALTDLGLEVGKALRIAGRKKLADLRWATRAVGLKSTLTRIACRSVRWIPTERRPAGFICGAPNRAVRGITRGRGETGRYLCRP